MSGIAVVGIVEKDNLILIGKKIKKDHYLSESWHILGGKVEENEDYEEALKREIKEEAGIDIKVKEKLDEMFDLNSNLKVIWYLCNFLDGDLVAGDDIQEVKFVSKDKIKELCSEEAVKLWPEKVVEYLER
jgi:mutator protein MutT